MGSSIQESSAHRLTADVSPALNKPRQCVVKRMVETDGSSFNHKFDYSVTDGGTRRRIFKVEWGQNSEFQVVLDFCLIESLAFETSGVHNGGGGGGFNRSKEVYAIVDLGVAEGLAELATQAVDLTHEDRGTNPSIRFVLNVFTDGTNVRTYSL
ncbi:unnamed protein product [Penicillium salamii]|nr:unnamed protein product [Penicillium salamii]